MKALSIKQPWLYCITDLDKRVENRSWKPPMRIIGKEIALHSSGRTTLGEYEAASRVSGIHLESVNAANPFPLGAIVATAVVVGWFSRLHTGSVPTYRREQLTSNKWYMGDIGWVFDDVRKIEPVKHSGALGLWELSDSVLARGFRYIK